jgi:hypothetical protein
MRNLFISFIFIMVLAFSSFAQIEEVRIIAEFGVTPCGHFNAIADVTHQEYKNSPNSLIYVIYYEAKNTTVTTLNKKTRKSETKTLNPVRGDAFGRAKELTLYLKTAYKVPENKVKFIDGGYKEEFAMEIWIVSKDAKPPTPKPTVAEKDVKFRKGKPRKPRECAKAYDGY